MMDVGLSGKSVIVTGAASGIGRATVHLLLAEGAHVLAVDRDGEGIDNLRQDGPQCRPLHADVSDENQADRIVHAALELTGRVDVLVNNAGVGHRAALADTTLAQWDSTFDVNVRAPFLLCRAAIPRMLTQGGGTIVNVASAAAFAAVGDRAAYCASKAAVIAMTKSITVDYAAAGIRANAVAPGTVDTPWIGRVTDGATDPAAMRAAMEQRQAIGRLAHPEEIADAVVYLASDRSSFAFGSTLVVDGGFSAQ